MAKMFIQRINKKTKTKTYTSVVLMENYREGKKVRHHIISNLSKWSEEMISSLDKVLKGEKIITVSDLQLSQGKSFGGIFAVSEIAKRLGIISENQDKIEAKIFSYRNNNEPIKEIFLYDVTSSYFESNK